MECSILHESEGRIRVHLEMRRMTVEQADILEYSARDMEGVSTVRVYSRTCDAVICYSCDRQRVISFLSAFSFSKAAERGIVPEHTGTALNQEYEERLVFHVLLHYLRKLILPAPVRHFITVLKALRFLKEGISCLLRGKIQVPVLDATAISVSVLRGDYSTAASVIFLLNAGELLEDWTRKRSLDDLARTLSLNVDKVWVRRENGEEVLSDVSDVKEGDIILVRAGNLIPLDAVVVSGEASVNQVSFTGESLPVAKSAGGYVYAGTVIEEGDLVLRVDKTSGSGRYDRIVRMIEDSEQMKSASENRAIHMADGLVPYSLGGTALTYLLTGNAVKAISILMVDFSCALKLAIPLAVLSAMKEAAEHHITVKGGRYMEAVSNASTIVFDKTGTLTHATPRVSRVVPMGNRKEDEVLRLAACLEEHYPHSLAKAVVEEAENRGLVHEERHTDIQYVVAHGIASTVDGRKVIIGSHHFVFEDEKVPLTPKIEEVLDGLPEKDTKLFLAINGRLAAVICIEDPLRQEAGDVVSSLRSAGFSRIVMMTGDNEQSAAAVASEVGVDDYRSSVLPEDKAEFIRNEHALGRGVVMVGDGINDSPALSEADAGIAISSGAAIAREIADITVASDDLYSLVVLKELSSRLMSRIDRSYRRIIGFNLALILLGVFGVLSPATSALLHNGSTILFSLQNTTQLLERK